MQWANFNNVGYIQEDFKPEQLQFLWDEVNQIDQSNLNDWFLKDSIDQLSNLLSPYIVEFNKRFNYIDNIGVLTKDAQIVLEKCWVNFQNKYEFQGLHNHVSVFSFVIWLQIPFKLDEERAISPNSSLISGRAGNFEFVHTDALGNIKSTSLQTIPNRMVLFPGNLNHIVYPFYTSDKQRISVAGNFKFRVN